MADKGHISTLIASKEIELHGAVRDDAIKLESFFVDAISTFCKHMIYDFTDRYLKVKFEVHNHSKNHSTIIINPVYCTTENLNENPKSIWKDDIDIHNYEVECQTLKYFIVRVLHEPRIAQDFFSKKLGAYKYNVTNIDNLESFTMEVIYLLGAQKNKPTA